VESKTDRSGKVWFPKSVPKPFFAEHDDIEEAREGVSTWAEQKQIRRSIKHCWVLGNRGGPIGTAESDDSYC